jgi:iron complex outermembrane receptor protein
MVVIVQAITLTAGIIFCPLFVQAAEPASERNLFELSLQEVLDLKVSLPSKKQEPLFSSPLSTSVVTRDEIISSGAASIPEALRLVPGVIVREQTPGNFDVHLRGFDQMPPHTVFPYAVNTSTLVMIDNRVVYNYFQGGTFWETLPISVYDVDRIEVVRGPAAALYGPNAATGVINIITRRPEKQGWSAGGHIEAGNYSTQIGQGYVTYNFEDRASLGINANFTERDRHQSAYYEFYRDTYVHDPADIIGYGTKRKFPDPHKRYPDPDNAHDNYGINAFLHLKPREDVQFDLRCGYQDSQVQKINVDIGATPLTTNDAQSYYVYLATKIKELSLQYAVDNGYNNVRGVPFISYDFINHDFTGEYALRLGHLLLQPGVNYRKTTYTAGFIGGTQELTTLAYSMRSEYDITEKVKAVAALRYDNYNHPSDTYWSWQFALTYAPAEKMLLRSSYSRAYRAPFFLDIFPDLKLTRTYLQGNRNLDMAKFDSYEIGMRRYVTDTLCGDLEAFYAITEDYAYRLYDKKEGRFSYYRNQNIPLDAEQFGATASITHKPSSTFLVKCFATWQRTRLDDYTPDYKDISNRESTRHRATPSVYGGLYINWRPLPRLTVNTNLYYYTRQRFDYEYASTHNGAKCIVNAKVDYRLTEQLSVFVNARNLFNTDTREFAFADHIRGTYLMGMEVHY